MDVDLQIAINIVFNCISLVSKAVFIMRDVQSTYQCFVESPKKSPISNWQFFYFKSQNVLYNSVVINISNPQLQLNYTAHFGYLKQKN